METPPVTPTPISEEPKKNNTPLIIGIVVVVVLCCCCIFFALAWQYGDQILRMIQGG